MKGSVAIRVVWLFNKILAILQNIANVFHLQNCLKWGWHFDWRRRQRLTCFMAYLRVLFYYIFRRFKDVGINRVSIGLQVIRKSNVPFNTSTIEALKRRVVFSLEIFRACVVKIYSFCPEIIPLRKAFGIVFYCLFILIFLSFNVKAQFLYMFIHHTCVMVFLDIRCLEKAIALFPGKTSCDVIYGLPGQTLDQWQEELSQVT